MPEPDLIDLIQRELDGATTPEEQARLRERLDQDAEARQFAGELRDVAQWIEEAPEAEPPADFSSAVMRAVAAHAAPQPAALAPVARPRFGRGWLAAGLAAAAVLAILLGPPLFRALDPANLRGTMIEPARGEQRWSVAVAPQTTAFLRTTPSQVELRFDAPHAESANITFDPNALRPVPQSSDARPGVIDLPLGRNATLTFDRLSKAATNVSITIRTHGVPDHSTSIEIPPATNF